MKEQKVLYPFRMGTRQRIQNVGSFPLNQANQQINVPFPQVGYIAAIMVRVRGSVTFSSAGAFAVNGPWNLLRRIQYGINLGNTIIYDTSGFGNFIMNHLNQYATNPSSSSKIFSAPTASGAQNWDLSYYIPISANNGNNFDAGLINLQAQEVRSTLNLQAGAFADVATNISAWNLVVDVSYFYYDVPAPDKVKQPPFVLHRILEDNQPIASLGDNIYIVPRAGTLLRLVHGVIANGARTDGNVANARIRLNRADENYFVSESMFFNLHRRRYGQDLPNGYYAWDFWHAQELPATGDLRDAYDLEKVTTFESIVNLPPTVTLGSNNNFLQSIREIVQQVVM